MVHRPDPEAIAPANTEALAYAERVEGLGLATPPPGIELSYGPDRAQKIDVYAPAGAEGLPVLIFFHGGAWVSGHRGWLRFMAPAVTSLPAVFVAVGYRLAPRCRWPAAYDDVCAAISFVRQGARSFGGNPERVAVGGHSAGGHLASLAVLRERLALVACLPVSASFNLQYGDVPLESDAGRVYKYLFSERSQDAEASPSNFAGNAATPFHITWGERDFERVVRSSAAMVEALKVAGAPVSQRIVPSASHFDTHLALADAGDPWYVRLREAFQRSGVPA
jgi:arylformamidase